MNKMNLESLSPARRRLIQLIREMGFGRIENLPIFDGEPDVDAAERYRTLRCGPVEMTHRRTSLELNRHEQDLIETMDSLVMGTISKIAIKHCLPLEIELRERMRASTAG